MKLMGQVVTTTELVFEALNDWHAVCFGNKIRGIFYSKETADNWRKEQDYCDVWKTVKLEISR